MAKYADLFTEFHDALDKCVIAYRNLYMLVNQGVDKDKYPREPFRIDCDNKRLKVLQLYNNILTELQQLEERESSFEEDAEIKYFAEYIPLKDCVDSGNHLKSCDKDGFCNVCGYMD